MEGPLHCVMICHVPHAVAVALHFRSCISFSPSRSVPLQSACAAGLGARRRRDPVLRAFSCLRARAGAREAAGARLPPVPAGAFFGPRHCFARAEKPKGGPGSRLLSTCILLHFPPSQSPCEQNMKLLSFPAGSRSAASGAMDGPRSGPGRRWVRPVIGFGPRPLVLQGRYSPSGRMRMPAISSNSSMTAQCSRLAQPRASQAR